MDKREIYIEIEKLRSKLTKEYEKCMDTAGLNRNVMELSQRMDQLILEYMKMSIPN